MLKEEIIANKGYVVFHMGEDDQTDEIAIKILKQDCPDFLLPFKTISIDGNMEFRYELVDGVRMSYQPNKMSRREFVQQMVSMLLPFENCGDWMLDYHYFCLNPQYIFINGKEQAVHYIYLPVRSQVISDKTIKDFFIRFVLGVDVQNDKGLILQTLRLFQDEHSNLSTILDFFQNEIGRETPIIHPANEPPTLSRREITQEDKKESDKNHLTDRAVPSVKSDGRTDKNIISSNQFGKSNLENDLMKKVYGEAADESKANKKGKRKEVNSAAKEKKKGILQGFIKKREKKADGKEVNIKSEIGQPQDDSDKNSSGIFVQNPEPLVDTTEENSGAVLLDNTEMAGDEYEEENLSVIRLKLENRRGYTVPENIELDLKKGYITVGRYDKSGYPCADFNFDRSLTFISRNHFRIERQMDGYKIIDLDSKNGTLLNGVNLVKNMPYELNSGDVIAISKKVQLTYRVL